MPYFDIELETLRCLDSFVQPRDRKVLEQLVGDIYVTGLYINSPEDYIIFSLEGMHWVHDTKVEWIEFQSIVSIDLPVDDLERVLHLTLRDDTIIPLLVANDTEGEPDLFVVRDFLVATWFRPSAAALRKTARRNNLPAVPTTKPTPRPFARLLLVERVSPVVVELIDSSAYDYSSRIRAPAVTVM